MKTRTPPKIDMMAPEAGFGSILWYGFDWWAEAIDYVMPQRLWYKFRDHKDAAKRLDDRLKTPIEIEFGEEQFQIMPTGAAGGKEFVLFNDDLRFEFSSLNRTWSTCWRATAAGLAEYGLQALRERVYKILDKEKFIKNPNHFEGDAYIKVTRFDYAFDIYSDVFTAEMVPALADTIVTPSEVKTRGDFWSRGHDKGHGQAKLKTLTIGSKKGCQVQIYNKCDEITEISGKEWVYDLWAEGGNWQGQLEDVWRIECRFAGDWLKQRTKKDPEEILSDIWSLISDALFNRRITVPTNDSNRRRWPLHPLFTMIIEEIENPQEFRPIGRTVTGKRDKLQEMLIANIAGTLRSSGVLMSSEGKEVDEEQLKQLAETALQQVFTDPEHLKKLKKAQQRYEFVEEAK